MDGTVVQIRLETEADGFHLVTTAYGSGPVQGRGLRFCSNHGDADELHHGCYPNLISDPQAAGSVDLIDRYESVYRNR